MSVRDLATTTPCRTMRSVFKTDLRRAWVGTLAVVLFVSGCGADEGGEEALVAEEAVAAATAAVEPTTAPVPTAPAATATAVPAETVPDPSAEEATPPSFPAITLATSTGGQIDFGSLQGQDTVLWFWAPW